MQNNDNTNKLYRHEALLYAIDFFSQGFDIGQIAKHAFDFINEILTLNSTAIFLREDKEFILYRSKNYGLESYKIRVSNRLKSIAQFHGNIIKEKFSSFLDDKDIKLFRPKLIIPLIVKDKILGFIISDGKVIGELDRSDYNIALTLMRLINKSLENTLYADELKQKNKELDLQVFNLFFVNQTTKTLLAELDIESVYSLCTDIIGEVTCSKITTFALYDEMKGNIAIKSYRDILSFTKSYIEFELIEKKYDSNNIILSYDRDKEKIKSIFKNWKDFEKLETEYIILIVKEDIVGFLTISKPVNDREYNKLMFELVESLASIMYISINNANLFKLVNEQKHSIEKKFNILNKLSGIIKSINSSPSIETLCNRVMKTLNIGFGIEKGFVILKENEGYEIAETVGFDTEIKTIDKTHVWESIDSNGIIYEFSSMNMEKYFEKNLCKNVGESNCLVISPIEMSNIGLEKEHNILGYMVVLKMKKSLESEEIILIDTISGSIAPIIKQLNYNEKIKKEYILNQRELFLKNLEDKMYSKKKYHIDFKIYYKKIIKKLFEDIDTTPYSDLEYYYFDNYLFVLSEYDLNEEDFHGYIELDDFNEISEALKKIS